MVPASRAGVLFTRDPSGAHPDVAVVSWSHGTAEALMQGEESGESARIPRNGPPPADPVLRRLHGVDDADRGAARPPAGRGVGASAVARSSFLQTRPITTLEPPRDDADRVDARAVRRALPAADLAARLVRAPGRAGREHGDARQALRPDRAPAERRGAHHPALRLLEPEVLRDSRLAAAEPARAPALPARLPVGGSQVPRPPAAGRPARRAAARLEPADARGDPAARARDPRAPGMPISRS